jgi:hypothetical protein
VGTSRPDAARSVTLLQMGSTNSFLLSTSVTIGRQPIEVRVRAEPEDRRQGAPPINRQVGRPGARTRAIARR